MRYDALKAAIKTQLAARWGGATARDGDASESEASTSGRLEEGLLESTPEASAARRRAFYAALEVEFARLARQQPRAAPFAAPRVLEEPAEVAVALQQPQVEAGSVDGEREKGLAAERQHVVALRADVELASRAAAHRFAGVNSCCER